MKTTLWILTFLMAGLLATTASADGLPALGVDVGPAGLGDERVRYVAEPDDGNTLLMQIERETATLLAARPLRGAYEIPVVAYDGTAGGLSADGTTLLLITPRKRFPRAKTTFAVFDTQSLRLRRTLTLRGDYSFDALSPRGRWLYLIHYTAPKDRLQYEVVVLDLRTGKIHSDPIVDPREPNEKMNGNPLTRVESSDGRWAYTLYEGTEHPFVHALDTAQREARCIDLDWLHGRKDLWQLRFALREDGRELSVRQPGRDPVAVVDTRTFEAARPSAAGVGSWPKTGLSLLALLAVTGTIAYVVRARRRSPAS
jgi:hypothetical protein